jgi:CDP-diacylglycerol--glycerol-3-phosphate 3-phosphatidyltransferase/cardiolipin synthase
VKLNLPLILTLGRVAAIPLVLLLFFLPVPHARQVACVLFAAAGFTDWLDGWLARRWNQTSAFGAFLDPVADKLLVAVCLVMLLNDTHNSLLAIWLNDGHRNLLVILVAIIISREITISALREWMAELGARAKVAVSWVGKFKTGFQMTAIGMMVWREPTFGLPWYELGYGLLIIAAALTIYSMFSYLRAAWPLLTRG